ncbi:hypothetical protein N6A79_07150 [Bartonella sp. HY761]|nr:hypothetical protein N6A79_07150 [Bartonella sp. HY761]
MMKKLTYSIIALGLTSIGISPALAADCNAVGQKIADEQGGQLSKATPTVQNGKDVCVVVVIIRGKDGEQPRRVEVAVPAN